MRVYHRRTRNRLDQFHSNVPPCQHSSGMTHRSEGSAAGRGVHLLALGSSRTSSPARITSQPQGNAPGAPATCPAQVRAQLTCTQTARPSERDGSPSASRARPAPVTTSPGRRGWGLRTPRDGARCTRAPTFHVPPLEPHAGLHSLLYTAPPWRSASAAPGSWTAAQPGCSCRGPEPAPTPPAS